MVGRWCVIRRAYVGRRLLAGSDVSTADRFHPEDSVSSELDYQIRYSIFHRLGGATFTVCRRHSIVRRRLVSYTSLTSTRSESCLIGPELCKRWLAINQNFPRATRGDERVVYRNRSEERDKVWYHMLMMCNIMLRRSARSVNIFDDVLRPRLDASAHDATNPHQAGCRLQAARGWLFGSKQLSSLCSQGHLSSDSPNVVSVAHKIPY